VAKSTGLVASLKELKNETEGDGGDESFKMRPSAKGRPFTDEYEGHFVSCMATEIFAMQCRDQTVL
jgi:hypothetical protein